jgi:hypothetical protein
MAATVPAMSGAICLSTVRWRTFPSPRLRLSITHILACSFGQSRRIASFSPGLDRRGRGAGGATLGKPSPEPTNPERVAASRSDGQDHCRNPFRVEESCHHQPRVARSSQPWAEGLNPFGIRPDGPKDVGNAQSRGGEGAPAAAAVAVSRCARRHRRSAILLAKATRACFHFGVLRREIKQARDRVLSSGRVLRGRV